MARTMMETPKLVKPIAASRVAMRFTALPAGTLQFYDSAMTLLEQKQHRLGLILVACAALAWSSAGFFTRLIPNDLMTMLFWRGLFAGSAVMLFFFISEGSKAFSILAGLRWPAFAVACLSSLGMITGIGALRYTSVADAMVIYATVPFVTAGLAYLFIGERPSRSTLIASAVALVGVSIMLVGSPWGGSMFGKFLAALMSLSMASFTVVMRKHREVAMLPAMGASAWITSFVCFWFASTLSVSPYELGLIALFGVVQNAAGLIFYAHGSRRVPAAEATLIAALEVPLTPFWVLVFMNEVPSVPTLIGGAVVLVALFSHILGEFRKTSPQDSQPFQVAP
jgi:drug/metabolite transporter (DMT)-like permease